MTTEVADLIGTTQTREMRADPASVDTEARTIDLAFSSEAPVERWFGREILDHAAGSVQLDRLRDGAPLLLQHDPERQIGVIESARIDADRVGRARVRFSAGPLGAEIMQDIADGIRSKVSVGYRINSMRLDESDDSGETYRVDGWEPMEISIVSIPADSSVGVGRAHQPTEVNTMADDAIETEVERDEQPTALETPETESREHPAAALVNPEADAIRAVGRHFRLNELAENHIMLGGNLAEFRALVRKQVPDPVPTTPRELPSRIESRIPYGGQLRAFTPERYGTRAAAEESAFRAGQFYRAHLFGDADAARWCRDHGLPLRSRAIDGAAAGQAALVPDELSATLISLKEQYGIAQQVCDVVMMSSDSRTVGVDTDDISAEWVGAGVAASESEPGFGFITLNAKRLRARTVIDNDYASDSVISLADHVAQKQARAFAIAEDSALFNGDGTSTYGGIVGIRTAILTTAGAIDAASGHDTLTEITAPDLRKVIAALPDIPGISPAWYTSKAGQELIFGTLADSAGGNTKRDIASGEQMQYAGYPIRTSPVMPKASAADLSNVAIVLFGDLRLGVKFGQRQQMEMMVNPYILMAEGQTEILSFERIDINAHGVGDASNAGPIAALIGE